jgi:hypothetical protein
MNEPATTQPCVTRLPEALEADAEAIEAAAEVQHALEVERATRETDAERLARESQ